VALLSYIALFNQGGFVPRDVLLEVFWPESDSEHARNSLNQALHGLRSGLGDGAMESRGKYEVRLNRQVVWCDVLAFLRAVREGRAAVATQLYRGDLLAGFHTSAGVGFQQWLGDVRRQLRRQFCDAAWHRAGEFEAAGDAAMALQLAREAVAKAPFDELALRRLMKLLVRLGDRAEALRAYERSAHRIAEELGVEPDPKTAELVGGIRAEGTAVSSPSSAR
jgi:DNA-binding SARP family transcriptional activator